LSVGSAVAFPSSATTLNHRCKTIEELMVQVVAFMRAYNQKKKLNPSLKLAAGVSGSRSVV